MRKAARIAGLVWSALVALAGIILWSAETMVWVGPVSSNRGLIYLVFGACLPGIALYRWGRGPYDPVSRVVAMLREGAAERKASKNGGSHS
jgi:hypothetical protein